MAVIEDGCRVCSLVLGVQEDSAGGVSAVGTFERDLEGHVKQIFIEDQSVIVVRRTADL